MTAGPPTAKILCGDWVERLRELPDQCCHMCCTSPPYWGLRDYGVAGQLGLEKTPSEYIEKLIAGFREVWRVLRDDGTCWVNLGDSYATVPYSDSHTFDPKYGGRNRTAGYPNRQRQTGLKHKDLVGIPWRVAFALQADGWYLRCDIIWSKPNAMPESVRDRPTRAHEYIFLLTKNPRYFYDAEAVKEPARGGAHPRANGPNSRMVPERAAGREDSKPNPSCSHIAAAGSGIKYNASFDAAVTQVVSDRNRRSVWTVPSQAYPESHFATYPEDLVKPCILAGTSARGCCPKCGAPWQRVVDRILGENPSFNGSTFTQGKSAHGKHNLGMGERTAATATTGWEPTCECKWFRLKPDVQQPALDKIRSCVKLGSWRNIFVSNAGATSPETKAETDQSDSVPKSATTNGGPPEGKASTISNPGCELGTTERKESTSARDRSSNLDLNLSTNSPLVRQPSAATKTVRTGHG